MRDLKLVHSRLRLCIRIAAVAYLLFVLAICFLMLAGGDRWWPATLILFGPRWLMLLPLLVLVPLAARRERRQLIVLFGAAVIVFGPVMNLCVPLMRKVSKSHAIRVLTCNIGGSELDTEKLRRLIRESGADIVALQECPEETAAKVLSGWTVVQEQSLVTASHYPIAPGKSLQAMHPSYLWPRCSLLQCLIKTPEGELSFCSLHLPSPRYGLSNLLDRHVILNLSRMRVLNEEQELRRKTSQKIEGIIRMGPFPVIIAGDFNMPVESVWYRQFWAGYSNAFSTAGFGYGLTEEVEIRGFKYKARIDHVLTHGDLAAGRCWVGPDVGSDHMPLIADIYRTESN
jgi:vancomycin resistance protein VanJ